MKLFIEPTENNDIKQKQTIENNYKIGERNKYRGEDIWNRTWS